MPIRRTHPDSHPTLSPHAPLLSPPSFRPPSRNPSRGEGNSVRPERSRRVSRTECGGVLPLKRKPSYLPPVTPPLSPTLIPEAESRSKMRRSVNPSPGRGAAHPVEDPPRREHRRRAERGAAHHCKSVASLESHPTPFSPVIPAEAGTHPS